MGGYSFNVEEIEKKLEEMRSYLRKNRNLTWKEEGELLEEVDTLKLDLKYAKERRIKTSVSPYTLPHVLEMKTRFPGPPSAQD